MPHKNNTVQKEFAQNGLTKLALDFFPDEPSSKREQWVKVMYDHEQKVIAKGAVQTMYDTDRFPEHPIPFACFEAQIDPDVVPRNQRIVFDYTDLVLTKCKLNGKREVLYSHPAM